MAYFYDLEKLGTFDLPNRILQDMGMNRLKPHNNGKNGIPNQLLFKGVLKVGDC